MNSDPVRLFDSSVVPLLVSSSILHSPNDSVLWLLKLVLLIFVCQLLIQGIHPARIAITGQDTFLNYFSLLIVSYIC